MARGHVTFIPLIFEAGPKKVRLYVNKDSMNFNDAHEEKAAQELTLSEEELAGKTIQLTFVKFQSVNSLQILVESNQNDSDTTVIQEMHFFGVSISDFNVSNIKKMGMP